MRPCLIPLSARTDESLIEVAGRYRDWLTERPATSLADFAYTTGTGRRHFPQRAALVVDSLGKAESLLAELERAGDGAGLFRGQARRAAKVAWQFTGQGSQYQGMARGLYDTQAVFRAALDQCNSLMKSWRGEPLLDVLFEDSHRIDQTEWTQPCLFALQMGLAHLLEHWGFQPDVVLGHSVGQYAAACVAGMLSWKDGLWLISERGRCIGELPAGGTMVAVFAPPERVEGALRRQSDVALAALNGTHVVISGPEAAVEAVAAELTDQGIRTQRLATSHAFHSSLMEPALEPFARVAEQTVFQPARLPLVCNMTGRALPSSAVLDGQYWKRHIHEPVRYAESIRTLRELDCDIVLELGPQPILTRMAAAVWDGPREGLISCLDRQAPDLESLLSAIARLYVQGLTPDFSKLDASEPRRRLVLPTYPFQRRRFWGPVRPQASDTHPHSQHPLLGTHKPLPGLPNETRYESWVGPQQPAWLEDHRVMDDVVFPGAAFVELALAAAPSHALHDVTFEQPLRPQASTCLHTVVREVRTDDRQSKRFEVYSTPRASSQWTRHVTANLSVPDEKTEDTGNTGNRIDVAALHAKCEQSMTPEDFYQALRGLGLQYGPEFQTIRELRFCQSDVLVRLESQSDFRSFAIPPTLLDGAFHALAIGLVRDAEPALFVPVGIERFSCFHSVTGPLWCHATWTEPTGDVRSANLTLCDEHGQVLARVDNLTVRRLSRTALRQMAGGGPQQLLYDENWVPTRLPPINRSPARWLVVHAVRDTCDRDSHHDTNRESDTLARQVRAALHANGQDVTSVGLLPDTAAANDETAPAEAASDEPESDSTASNANQINIAADDSAQWNRVLEEWLAAADASSEAKTETKTETETETQPVGHNLGIVWLATSGSDLQGPTTTVGPRADDTRRHCAGLLNLLHALHAHEIRKLDRGLQIVTRGGVLTVSGTRETPTGPVDFSTLANQRQYWGLGRVIGAEQPELGCRLIDLPLPERSQPNASPNAFPNASPDPSPDPSPDAPGQAARTSQAPAEAAALIDVLLNDTQENQIAIRDGRSLVARLQELRSFDTARRTQSPSDATAQTSSPPAQSAPLALVPEATYLITGGLGMLGRQAALWLARRGARDLVLVSRRGPSESARELIAAIERLGCRVRVEQADVGVREDVRRLIELIEQNGPPLRGVLHAAGVLDDGLLADQSWARFEQVLASKADAARWLHELTVDCALDFFVLYSSVASVLGSPGQGNYATANAFLDGLAWERHALGLPALSVNWGPWTVGMADDELVQKRLALQGITPLTVDEAHASLEQLLTSGAVQATVLDVDWPRMIRGLGPTAPQLLAELAPVTASATTGDSAFVEKLRGLQSQARERLLIDTLQAELQQVLSTDESPDTNTPLIDMGLDSLMAVEFSTRLQQRFGEEFGVSPTLLFDYPTISAMAGYLLELVTDLPETNSDPEPPVAETGPQTAVEHDEIAIVGMACRFPGASGIEAYWRNLQQGVDAIREVPPDRWNVDEYYSPEPAPGKMYSREGGFIDGIRGFDAEFFNISDQEACWTDPQHRLLLEVSWEALEDAGMARHPFADSRIGVFMGIMSQDYAEALSSNDVEVIEGFQGAGLSHSAGVGRISYAFGFEGPSIAVDSASSSSLVAVCQAAKSLRDGECHAALAGGVNAILTPTNTLLLSRAGMLSPDGRCKSFSASANGFARGEGCGVVVLKRRKDAERDGDRILAIIRGSAVCHNGFSGGITTPNGRAQERVIREALESARLQPTDVQYLEAHGTGTPLGDPIEIRAAAAALGKGRPPEQPLLVGSVKANIGHLEAAGGISGLIKTVLAMQRGEIPGQLHFEEPSPHVPWRQLPLKVVTEPTPWPEPPQERRERIAGVTALGLTGTNAHIILSASVQNVVADSGPVRTDAAQVGPEKVASAETPLAADTPQDRSQHLLVLSARKPAALTQLAERYLCFVESNAELALADICYSAATGRRHFEHRAALIAGSIDEARELLQSLVTETPSPQVRTGLARSTSPMLGWLFTELPRDGDTPPVLTAGSLYQTEPVFRDVIEQCEAALSRMVTDTADVPEQLRALFESQDGSLHLRDWIGSQTPDFNRLAAGGRLHADVGLFALQMGLARLWQSWGVQPDVVAGFGIGQYAAACLTGVMHLDSAVMLVAARANVLQSIADAQDEGADDNASTVLNAFEAFADTVDYFPTDRHLVCELTGKPVPVHRLLGGSYWRRHCVEVPQRHEALQCLSELDCQAVLELGVNAFDRSQTEPAPNALTAPNGPTWIASLRPDLPASTATLQALANLYVLGLTPDFERVDQPWHRRKLGLPTYPFQHSEYWITDVARVLSSADAKP